MNRSAARGFTMVELVVVMVLTGILGAVAAERFFDRRTVDGAGYAAQARAMLRYAQKLAIAQQRPVFVVPAANRLALCHAADCAPADWVRAPAGANSGSRETLAACASGDWYCEGLPSGISASGGGPFFFDALGRPVVGSTPAAPLPLRITAGPQSYDVTVVAETGYVD